MNCPICQQTTKVSAVDEIEIDRCTGCEGIWFDLREHEHLAGRDRTAKIDSGDPAKGDLYDDNRDIDCPRCHTKLVKLAFPEQPHIRYEGCATCGGVFLDAGEFADFAGSTLLERLSQVFAPIRQKIALKKKQG